jgi:hypothetical protein
MISLSGVFVCLLVFFNGIDAVQSFQFPSFPLANSRTTNARSEKKTVQNQNGKSTLTSRIQDPLASFGLTSLMMAGDASRSSSSSSSSCPSCGDPTTGDHPNPCDKSPLKIIIAGAPASGKGTQCEVTSISFSSFFLFVFLIPIILLILLIIHYYSYD